MCIYCKAASFVLDTLWAEEDIRQHFYAIDLDLAALGTLVHEVFVPAYRSVKDRLDVEAMKLLQAQVTEALLAPYYNRSGFQELWNAWDDATRDEFIREQSELHLAQLLIRFYADQFADAYKAAYVTYKEN